MKPFRCCEREDVKDVFRADGSGGEHVVRWCSWCGTVRVDFDYDGRTRAGRAEPSGLRLRDAISGDDE